MHHLGVLMLELHPYQVSTDGVEYRNASPEAEILGRERGSSIAMPAQRQRFWDLSCRFFEPVLASQFSTVLGRRALARFDVSQIIKVKQI